MLSDPHPKLVAALARTAHRIPLRETSILTGIIHEFSPILRKFLELHQMCQVAQKHSVGERGP